MKRFLSLLIMAFSLNTLALEPIKPKTKRYPLKEFNQLQLKVVPQQGTRISFPFVLDDQTPGPQVSNTNPTAFVVNGSANNQINTATNELVITANLPNPDGAGGDALGQVFVSVGGHQITISLSVTYDVRQHVTDVVYEAKDVKFTHLLEKMAQQQVQSIKEEYDLKLKEMQQQAKDEALKYLTSIAIYKPEYTRFDSNRDVTLKNRDEFELYFGEMVNYGNEYIIIDFEIEHEGLKTIGLEQYQLGVYKDKDEAAPQWVTPLHVNCADRILPNQSIRCAMLTTDTKVLENKQLELRVQTTGGEMVAKW